VSVQFVYKPEGAEPKKWDFRPDKLMNAEAEAIERLTKMTYGQWSEAVTEGSVLAIHGLLYVLLKREVPTLKWDQVQFSMSEVDFELTDQETADTIAALEEKERAEGLDMNERALLEQLHASTDDAAAGDDESEDAAPKS
jgi:hypothetical protein